MADNKLQLLPCPFCGKQPGMRRYAIGTQNTKFLETWAIECYCGMAKTKGFETVFKRDADTGEFVFEKDGREEAIKKWNARAPEPLYKECATCAHNEVFEPCDAETIGDCSGCTKVCTCAGCVDYSNWERGGENHGDR